MNPKRLGLLALGALLFFMTANLKSEEPTNSPAATPTETAPAPQPSSDAFMLDNMDEPAKNSVGGRNAVYQRAPSRCSYSKSEEYGKKGAGLKLIYDKKNEGGPNNDGGFCGFYSILHKGRDDYLDISQYKYLTFWVKGEKGDEKFKIGAADKTQAETDDSVKSPQEVGTYLPKGKITTEWQQAVVPVEEWFVDWHLMHSISFCFEGDIFDNGIGSGIVYIDEVEMRKTKPAGESKPSLEADKPKSE